MDDHNIKQNLIQHYLAQQLSAPRQEQHQQQQHHHHDDNRTALQHVELPDNIVLDDFKNQVRMWIEVDNFIKKLHIVLRERNVIKKELTDKILRFMAKYNIEDLNTKDGSRLRYSVTQVRAPLNQNMIKEKIIENFGKTNTAEDLTQMIFNQREKVEKVTLRRLKVRGSTPALESS